MTCQCVYTWAKARNRWVPTTTVMLVLVLHQPSLFGAMREVLLLQSWNPKDQAVPQRFFFYDLSGDRNIGQRQLCFQLSLKAENRKNTCPIIQGAWKVSDWLWWNRNLHDIKPSFFPAYDTCEVNRHFLHYTPPDFTITNVIARGWSWCFIAMGKSPPLALMSHIPRNPWTYP